jgi:DNA invertase Pin-like site-specific DNA recombinase
MAALLIGYARVSTDEQDLTAQRDALAGLGVEPARVYVDHGLTGTTRDRPGLREALAAAAPATLWSSRNSTGWPGPCRTLGKSSRT